MVPPFGSTLPAFRCSSPSSFRAVCLLIQRRTLTYSGALVSDGPDGPGGEDQVEDFKLKSNPSLPGFAVASFAVGKRKEELDNRKPLQIAISAFVLYNVSLGGDVNFQDEFLRTNSLQFYQDDRAAYFAAAIGHRPTRHFSWGITLLARNRVIQHVETTSLAVGGTQDPSRGSPCPTSPTIPFCVFDATQISRNTVFSMNSWDLSLRIGLLNLIGKRWRLGLMFQPPGLHVGGKSNLRFELTDVVSSNAPVDPGLSDSVFGTPQSDARSPIPWELRFGVSYVISSKVAVAADVQFVGRVPDGSLAPGTPQLEDRANTSGILLADSTKRDFTWNVSVGSEIQITSSCSLGLGSSPTTAARRTPRALAISSGRLKSIDTASVPPSAAPRMEKGSLEACRFCSAKARPTVSTSATRPSRTTPTSSASRSKSAFSLSRSAETSVRPRTW